MTAEAAMFPEWDQDMANAAREARDEALDRVEANSDPGFDAASYRALVAIAKRRPEFTTDPIWTLLEAWKAERPHEPRALGPVMLRAVKTGVCASTGRYRKSVRPECHCRPILVYRSLIYRDQPAEKVA